MQNPTTNSTAAPDPKELRRCRCLRVNGLQCESWALRGHDFCFTHKKYRHPECPQKGSKIVVPLLDDHSSIQLLISQVAHGVLSGELDNDTARSLAYACQVAACTLPRPLAVRPKPADAPQPIQQPVSEIVTGPDGDPLGPDEIYRSPTAARPIWSFDKYLLDNYCQMLNMPRITRPEDLPPSGWLTEEETTDRKEDTEAFFDDYKDRILDARRQCDIQGLLPPIELRQCVVGTCDGPGTHNPCCHCRRERDEHAAPAAADSTQNNNEAQPEATSTETDTLDLNASAESQPGTLPHTPHPGLRRGISNSIIPPTPSFERTGKSAATRGYPCLAPRWSGHAVSYAARSRKLSRVICP